MDGGAETFPNGLSPVTSIFPKSFPERAGEIIGIPRRSMHAERW